MTMGFYIEGLTWLDSRGIACSVLHIAYCVLCNGRVAVSLFSKGFCLGGRIIPKYLRYYWYPLSILLIQYQQIAAGCWMLVSEE